MKPEVTESVGNSFNNELLQLARDKTLLIINELSQKISPGMTEAEAIILLHEIQKKMGAPKSWHPPQVRFGLNTLLPFGQKSEVQIELQNNDIFFIDIGPIFDGHEGDVGRTFAIGTNSDMQKCVVDVETIWNEVRNFWYKSHATGHELYKFADSVAKNYGWLLSLQKANGHRISDFPHAAKNRRSIEGFEYKPSPNRWILEIQIRHPSLPFGAFYEDLLN